MAATNPIKNRLANIFNNKVDVDGNGVLTFPEFVQFAMDILGLKTGELDFCSVFTSIDKDRNGTVSEQEFIEYYENRYARCTDELSNRMKKLCAVLPEGSYKRRLDLSVGGEGLDDDTDSPCVSSQQQANIDTVVREHKGFLNTLKNYARPEALRVLHFWFPGTVQESMNLWFGKSPSLDQDIETKFGGLVRQAAAGDLDSWQCNPLDCLALIILLDQFPRNMYRHSPKMYDTDQKAQGIVAKAVYYNHHKYLTPLECIFMPCLVLTHAENIHLQEMCVEIWNHYVQPQLPPGNPFFIFEGIFRNHLTVIQQFGHFPHRNNIMNRTTTQSEVDCMAMAGFRFDLPLVYEDDGSVRFQVNEDFLKADKTGATEVNVDDSNDLWTMKM